MSLVKYKDHETGQWLPLAVATGATFEPHVSENGDLSWTNNMDLENPETVNIKGKDGVSISSVSVAAISEEDEGVNVISVILSNGEESLFEVRNGSKGSDGYTPQKGVDYFDGKDGKDATVTSENIVSALGYTPANKADIAATAMQALSNSSHAYVKISNFGNWGTGNWATKGFSMLITSRAGELVWVSVSSDDSNTNAKAIRLLNTYSKISNIYYSASENALYVKANAWCNNINAHILSNVNGDYVPTVASASALASDAVEINIVEFGVSSDGTVVGDTSVSLALGGKDDRPTYNGNDLALKSDVPSNTETWTFTLEDGSTVTKKVVLQ